VRALDLFCGVGWGVACQRLAITEHGADTMPAVTATREAAGMVTPYGDVLDLDPAIAGDYDLLIASPPCQTFSRAGNGVGRAHLDMARWHAQHASSRTRVLAETHDLRTALVLEPLRFALAGGPPYIIWEQVPSVLPFWEVCADILRANGYRVLTGIVATERYGVPQTRRRAFLLASMTAEPTWPAVTHSAYYSRDPERFDPGVKPWVSIGEALGWPADWTLRSNYGTGGDPAERGEASGRTSRPDDDKQGGS
jgi:DNA (cytosine-5)-methyltransferase 1